MTTPLASRLKERMKVVGMSAAELARRVNISPVSVHLWLDGTTKSIKGANLLRAATALEVTPEWLSSGLGRKFPNDPITHETRSPQAYYGDPIIGEAIELLQTLTPSSRAEALSFLKIFAAKKGVQKPRREHIPIPAASEHAA